MDYNIFYLKPNSRLNEPELEFIDLINDAIENYYELLTELFANKELTNIDYVKNLLAHTSAYDRHPLLIFSSDSPTENDPLLELPAISAINGYKEGILFIYLPYLPSIPRT